ncbi:MAG: N-acetylmuramoyl-L-alanine amidase [Draconibacterium sp.]
MRNKSLIIISICIAIISISKSAFCKSQEKNETRVSVVVIDPGHGGKDFGASVGNAREKDIVLDLALRLGNSIKRKYPDTKVIYTRSTDIFIPLHERARIANKNKADLFISIHVNGAESKTPYGTETFVLGEDRQNDNFDLVKKENSVILLEDDYTTSYEGYDPNSPESNIMFLAVQSEYLDQSIMLASAIQDQFRLKAKRFDRSVKQAGFLVLRQVTMPGVLVETGFISNTEERNYLVSEIGKSELSNAIFNAFEEYKHKIENHSSFAVRTENKAEEIKEPLVSAQTELTEEPLPIEKNEPSVQTENNVYYSVQIAASKKKLEPNAANFKGLKNVFRTETNGMFRYYSGKFGSENEAEKGRKSIVQKFPDSFVVVFENEKQGR